MSAWTAERKEPVSREHGGAGAEEIGKKGIGSKINWKERECLFLWSQTFYSAHLSYSTMPELTACCQDP